MRIQFEIRIQRSPLAEENTGKFLCLLLVFVLLSALGYAQGIGKTEILSLRKQGIQRLMKENYDFNSLLKYGKEYKYTYPNTKGNQFLDRKVLDHWTIIYDGLTFDHVTLRYDNYNGIVLTPRNRNSHTNFLILDNRKISKFTIGRRQFIYFRDSLDQVLDEGIYELAFNGDRSRLLISTLKKLDSPLYREYQELDKFVTHYKYYLQTSNGVFRITNKKDLLQKLDSDSDLKGLIKQNRLRLRMGKKETRSEIVQVLSHYDTLYSGESEPLRDLN